MEEGRRNEENDGDRRRKEGKEEGEGREEEREGSEKGAEKGKKEENERKRKHIIGEEIVHEQKQRGRKKAEHHFIN